MQREQRIRFHDVDVGVDGHRVDDVGKMEHRKWRKAIIERYAVVLRINELPLYTWLLRNRERKMREIGIQ